MHEIPVLSLSIYVSFEEIPVKFELLKDQGFSLLSYSIELEDSDGLQSFGLPFSSDLSAIKHIKIVIHKGYAAFVTINRYLFFISSRDCLLLEPLLL
jgi:hypothetical protein